VTEEVADRDGRIEGGRPPLGRDRVDVWRVPADHAAVDEAGNRDTGDELADRRNGEPRRRAVRDAGGSVGEPALDRQRRLVVVADEMDDAGERRRVELGLERVAIEARQPAQPSGASSSPGSANAVAPRAEPAADIASR
jgi:hypothetical protein